jgi:sulfotransferase
MLTMQPIEMMKKIYNFIGEEYYEHDFDNVEQVTWEKDELHGFGPTLHQIRPKVAPQPSKFPEVLGEAAEKYKQECDFWKTL